MLIGHSRFGMPRKGIERRRRGESRCFRFGCGGSRGLRGLRGRNLRLGGSGRGGIRCRVGRSFAGSDDDVHGML